MSEISKVSLLDSKPGIRRDGTNLDADYYSDGQWVRFQRGRPKKMGGYSKMSDRISGPVRDNVVWSRSDMVNVFSFSTNKIEMIQVDQDGNGSSIVDLTPLADFTGNDNYLWSTANMYDSAAGSEAAVILAVPTNTANNIDDFTENALIYGLADGSTEFEVVADVNAVASGGVFVSAPYAILYGSDGKVTWSNANEPLNYTTGDAGTNRATGSKIVKGLPIQSGSGAAGLLWSIDSLIKMDYIGGAAIFRFTRLGSCSIIAQNSAIEYDGIFYWIGIDRFYASNGGSPAELPNDMNINWFFDNLNYTYRNKIWAMKIPRYGEIWWFYPRGNNTECSHAIILNVREKIWYDCELPRSSGFYSQVFRYPIMVSSEENDLFEVIVSSSSGDFKTGDILLGTSSGAIGTIITVTSGSFHLKYGNGNRFEIGEGISNTSRTGAATIDSITYFRTMYVHEKGHNKVDEQELAIKSWFTNADFGLPANQMLNRNTRLTRIEPDFLQEGSLSVEVLGHDYANSEETIDGPFDFTSSTEKIDIRVQRRHLQLRVTSNEVNGHYEMGKTILWTEPGDVRP